MTLSTHITNALASAHAYGEAIDLARKDAKGMTHDQVRAVILPIVASNPKYDVPLIDGMGKAKGTKVLDSTHAKYETARKAVNRLLKDICGDASSGKQEEVEVEVPAEIIEAAMKLAKLAQKYEGARSLASKAVAIAFAQ